MRIEDLKLENFRNYNNLNLKLNTKVNLFLGKNGEGKTNLLEAIYFALHGHSFRFADTKDLILHSSRSARIEISIWSQQTRSLIVANLQGKKSSLTLNGKATLIKKLRQTPSSVVFTPESLSVVKEGPAERRRLLDDLWLTVSPAATETLTAFIKCLASKNRVLKESLEGQIRDQELHDLLASLNASFLPLAQEVTWGRIQAAKQAAVLASKSYATLQESAEVEILVDYVISGHSTIDWSKNQVYDLLASRLTELQIAEMRAGVSLVGPHKHDVRFLVNGKDARIFCSQGQQRAVALAFKIAEVQLSRLQSGEDPVLLLDDVFSELDVIRRERLLSILRELRGQIVLTSIDDSAANYFGGPDLSIFHVNKGLVTHQDGTRV